MKHIFNNLCYDDNNELIEGLQLDWIHHEKARFDSLNLDDKPVTKLGTVILFANRWDGNWYHFLAETLHLLHHMFDDNFMKDNGDKLTILLKHPTDNTKYCYEIIELLGFTKYVQFIEKDHVYRCDQLITSINYHELYNRSKNFHTHNALLDAIIDNATRTSTVTCYDNIYLTREHIDVSDPPYTPKRWIINQSEASKAIIEKGYHSVRVDNLHIRDQIKIIHSAKKIVSFIGAGCDNILFTNDKCMFTVVYSENPHAWWVERWSECNAFVPLPALTRHNDVHFNPTWGAEDSMNGPYHADIGLIHTRLK